MKREVSVAERFRHARKLTVHVSALDLSSADGQLVIGVVENPIRVGQPSAVLELRIMRAFEAGGEKVPSRVALAFDQQRFEWKFPELSRRDFEARAARQQVRQVVTGNRFEVKLTRFGCYDRRLTSGR